MTTSSGFGKKQAAPSREDPLAIVIMGVSGSGKTTVGQLLANKIGAAFLEGDSFHPKANVEKMASGMPLADEDRWPWLDWLGAAFRGARDRGETIVGTCSALKRSYRDRLRSASGRSLCFVCLQATPLELKRRLTERIGHYMPPALLGSQLDILELPQADEDSVVVSSERSADQVVQIVLEYLRRGDASRTFEKAGA